MDREIRKLTLFSSSDPADWPDNLPPCLVYVDAEGRMWHKGAEMVRANINRVLAEHVELDEKNRYVIDYQGQRCFVDVEDTFFVILRVDHLPETTDLPEAYLITLNHGYREELDPASLRIGADNIIYATVRDGRFPARFLRKSYYQLAEFLEERDGVFSLPLRGRHYPIK